MGYQILYGHAALNYTQLHGDIVQITESMAGMMEMAQAAEAAQTNDRTGKHGVIGDIYKCI